MPCLLSTRVALPARVCLLPPLTRLHHLNPPQATRFLKAGATRLEAFLWLMPFFLSTPIAIYIGLALSQTSDTVVAIFQGLSAGTFIYVGAFDVLSNQARMRGGEGCSE